MYEHVQEFGVILIAAAAFFAGLVAMGIVAARGEAKGESLWLTWVKQALLFCLTVVAVFGLFFLFQALWRALG